MSENIGINTRIPLLTEKKIACMKSRGLHFSHSECRKKRKLGKDLLCTVEWISFWRKYLVVPASIEHFEVIGSGLSLTKQEVLRYINTLLREEEVPSSIKLLEKIRLALFPDLYS